MSQLFVVEDPEPRKAVIKVMGVGGGGGNAINHMYSKGESEVSYLALNTDSGHLGTLSVPTLPLGMHREAGLGAGADPERGRDAAHQSEHEIESHLDQVDMLFIAAGMGGGTGTGAAPVVAELARKRGILTVAVVTKPFSWELPARKKIAEEGIEKLCTKVDSIITISNDKLSETHSDQRMEDAFARANDILCTAVGGISDLVMKTGRINVDFADLSRIMRGGGKALIGVGEAFEANRAKDAMTAAMSSPLLENVDMKGSTGLLVNVTSGRDLTLQEFTQINGIAGEIACESAQLIAGWVVDEEMEGSVRVTLVVTIPSPEANYQPVIDKISRDGTGARDYSKLETPITNRTPIHVPSKIENAPSRPLRAQNGATEPVEPEWTNIQAYVSR